MTKVNEKKLKPNILLLLVILLFPACSSSKQPIFSVSNNSVLNSTDEPNNFYESMYVERNKKFETENSGNEEPKNKEELVEYKGIVEHIFFHPLIIYPEKAFDGDYLSKGYNDWFVTVYEFKKIIESLYQKDYILVDINDTFDTAEICGTKMLVRKNLMIPKGKKPLIISIDDMNYYEYMISNGNAHKLIIDDGIVKTYSEDSNGQPIISHDNDIVPILDNFVNEHPDFSLNGAKGVIALTGYEGILGYRTNELESPSYENEKKEALNLVDKLKSTGWTFACHGYGHLDTNEIDINRLMRDTNRWKSEVEPLTGPTSVYIYPFGSAVDYTDPKFKFLMDSGFYVFCGVGPQTLTEYKKDCIITDRRPIDGISMHNAKRLADLFDVNDVVDKVRPEKYGG